MRMCICMYTCIYIYTRMYLHIVQVARRLIIGGVGCDIDHWAFEGHAMYAPGNYKYRPFDVCVTLQRTAIDCNTLQRTVTHGNTFRPSKPHCNAIYTTMHAPATTNTAPCKYVLPYYTLQHPTTHCDTLQHTATHFNTLQHAATHLDSAHHTATL